MANLLTANSSSVNAATVNKFVQSQTAAGTAGVAIAACYFAGTSTGNNPTATVITGFSTAVTRTDTGTYTLTMVTNWSNENTVYDPTASSNDTNGYYSKIKSSNSTGCVVCVFDSAGDLSDTPYVNLIAVGSRA